MRTILWYAGVAAVVLVWLSMDGIDDHSTERAKASLVEEALEAAQQRARFERMAQRICGPQAGWTEVEPRVVQCLTKHGRPVGRKANLAVAAR